MMKAFFNNRRKQRNEAATGLTRAQKKRNQVKLKGRGRRERHGEVPRRGPGRTAHGRR